MICQWSLTWSFCDEFSLKIFKKQMSFIFSIYFKRQLYKEDADSGK